MAWISCVGEKGGAEVYMINLLRHLPPERFRPGIILLRPGPLAGELRGHGWDVWVLPRHRMRNVLAVARAILTIRRLVRAEGISILHSNGFRAHAYGGPAARLAGVPEVWSVHTVEQPGWSTRAILGLPPDHVTGNCPRTVAFFARHGLPTSLIWPAVETASPAAAPARTELARRFGLPVEARWILQGARLQRYKGQHHFIRALASLGPEFRDVHAIIAGGALFDMEPDYPGQLRALAQELGVGGRVHFTGFLAAPDVLAGLIRESELMVHPALDEDFGLIIAEAQALERPVLAFAAVGPAAIIEHDVTGRLVPVGDQAALDRELAALLGRPDRLVAMGRAGARRVAALFAAPAAGRRLAAVYEAVLAGRQPVLAADFQPVIGPP